MTESNWWASTPGWATRLPVRLSDTWRWFEAIWSYDYGDPRQLAELVRNEPIPPEYTNAVATIIAGERLPNRKAAAKAKIPASKRAETAVLVSVCQSIRDDVKQVSAENAHTIEPVELMRNADELGRDGIQIAAEHWGVSPETIENLVREAKARLSAWPAV